MFFFPQFVFCNSRHFCRLHMKCSIDTWPKIEKRNIPNRSIDSPCMYVHSWIVVHVLLNIFLLFLVFKTSFSFCFKEAFGCFLSLLCNTVIHFKMLNQIILNCNRWVHGILIFEGMFLVWGRPNSSSRR